MASITIRNLDEALKRRLRVRAAENNRSMEQEAREILREAYWTRKRRRPRILERPSTSCSNPSAAWSWISLQEKRCANRRG